MSRYPRRCRCAHNQRDRIRAGPLESGPPAMLFASAHPLVHHKLALMRHLDTEPKKFRELVRELSMLLCYEATRDLELVPDTVPTPMGTAEGHSLRTKIGLVPILRAGLGMVEGVLEMIPTAEGWHIGLYR